MFAFLDLGRLIYNSFFQFVVVVVATVEEALMQSFVSHVLRTCMPPMLPVTSVSGEVELKGVVQGKIDTEIRGTTNGESFSTQLGLHNPCCGFPHMCVQLSAFGKCVVLGGESSPDALRARTNGQMMLGPLSFL